MFVRAACLLCLLAPVHGVLRGPNPQLHLVATASTVHVGEQAKLRARFAEVVKPAIDAALSSEPVGDADIAAKAIKAGASVIDFDTAVDAKVDEKKLPSDVLDIVKSLKSMKVQSKDKKGLAPPKLSKKAAEKAINTLNGMITTSQGQWDDKALECLVFREQNKAIQKQVDTDLRRMSATINNLKRQQISFLNEISQTQAASDKAQEELDAEELAFKTQEAIDKRALKGHTEDLEVTEFMLEVSRCKGKEAVPELLQTTASGGSTGFTVCKGANGTQNYTFDDERLEAAKARMTPQGLQALMFELDEVQALTPVQAAAVMRAESMAMGDGLEDLEDGDDTDPALPSTLASPGLVQTKKQQPAETLAEAPQSEMADAPEGQKPAYTCAGTKPNCGVLHDRMSALWGVNKDLVEKLSAEMADKDAAWRTTEKNYNALIDGLATKQGTLDAALAEAYSSQNTEADEQNNKEIEMADLQAEYMKKDEECNKTMEELLFTDICGTITVRNEIVGVAIEDMTANDVVDCSFTSWKHHKCSVACDDEMVGGLKQLEREVITNASLYGSPCPKMEEIVKCNMIKCPVNCKHTDFQEWDSCSVECGGGVQSRVRTNIDKPKNGGTSCEALEESRPCNTFSCNRNCVLKQNWERWGPCSKACDGGVQFRKKLVDPDALPMRGAKGSCPGERDHERFWTRECNMNKCVGDEKCIAKMDLVLLVDGSGSITKSGFEKMKKFLSVLVDKFEEVSYGESATEISIVQFGNGKLLENRIVSDALLIQPLSGDMVKTKETVEAMKWQKGFTNMAQGIQKAHSILSKSMRAQSVFGTCIVITDGKPSFTLSTDAAVEKLRKSATLVIVQVKSAAKEEEINQMKGYVSEPADVNYLLIKGKKELRGAFQKYANDVMITACPRAASPTLYQPPAYRLFDDPSNVFCKSPETIYHGASMGLEDCESKCTNDNRCGFYSIWNTNNCTLTVTCAETEKSPNFKSVISIFEKIYMNSPLPELQF